MTRLHRRPGLMPRMSENWPRDRWFWSDAEGPIRPRCRSAFPTSERDREADLNRSRAAQQINQDLGISRRRSKSTAHASLKKWRPQPCRSLVRLRLARRAAAQINALGRLPNRLQFAEHRRDELGDRRMDRHGTLQHRIRRAGIHHVDDAVDRLVTASPEDRGSEDLPRLGIDDDLHKPLRLAFLDRAPDAAHRPMRAKQRAAAGAGLSVRHADPAERRIDVKGVPNNAVADLACLA